MRDKQLKVRMTVEEYERATSLAGELGLSRWVRSLMFAVPRPVVLQPVTQPSLQPVVVVPAPRSALSAPMEQQIAGFVCGRCLDGKHKECIKNKYAGNPCTCACWKRR